MIRLFIIFIIVVISLGGLVSSEPIVNLGDSVTDKPIVKLGRVQEYCSVYGCTINGDLVVNGNVTFISDVINMTVLNYNVTGIIKALGFEGDGSGLTNINDTTKVEKSGDTMTGNLDMTGNNIIRINELLGSAGTSGTSIILNQGGNGETDGGFLDTGSTSSIWAFWTGLFDNAYITLGSKELKSVVTGSLSSGTTLLQDDKSFNFSGGIINANDGITSDGATVKAWGIQNQNLVDKSAIETIQKSWTFTERPLISSITQGHIMYAGASGIITGESNLFWDTTNNRLGVGTNVPTNPLHTKFSGSKTVMSETSTNNQARFGATDGTATYVWGLIGGTDTFNIKYGVTFSGGKGYLQNINDYIGINGILSSTTFSIDGKTDQAQLKVQGHSTQTNPIAVFEQSSGTDVVNIENDGSIEILSDSVGIEVGSVGDASFYYDGTDAIINPKVVGSGKLQIQGETNFTENVSIRGNISMYSPDGTLYNCGVQNGGTFVCS